MKSLHGYDLEIAARTIVSVNPATGEVLRELECAGEKACSCCGEGGEGVNGVGCVGVRDESKCCANFSAGCCKEN